jgi:putative ABC transport system permease protein
MQSLLRPISFRRIAEHRLRAVMTATGIALGVAVLIAVVTVNRGIVGSFSNTLDEISGKVHLEVRGGDTGLDEGLLEQVRAVPGVQFATPVIQRTLDVADGQGDSLAILGINFTEDPNAIRFFYNLDPDELKRQEVKKAKADEDFDEDPFALLDAKRQLVVTQQFAARWKKAKGETIDLMTQDGRQPFTIYSVAQAHGPLKAMGGNLAIMDYVDAQETFGLQHRVDRFDIAVRDAKDPGQIDAVALGLRKALGGKYDVERPGKRQERQEHMLRSFKLALAIGAGVSLIVGMFLIYHTLSISVAQRRTEIGILRAAGATRRQIVALFTVEGTLFGLAGSLLGLGLGAILARFMLEQSAESVGELYMRVDRPTAEVPTWALVAGLLIGTACSALAALLPAWRASRLSPVETIRNTAYDFKSGPPDLRLGAREWVALGIWALVPLVAQGPAIDGFPAFGLFSMFLVVLGATLLSRWIVVAANRVLGPICANLLGIEGRLAADNVTRNAGKAAVTVASLMVGLSMVMGSAILTHSFRASIDTWVQQTVPADLFVTSGNITGGIKNSPVDPKLAAEIATVPGVQMVDMIRLRNIDYADSRVMLLSLQTRIRFARKNDWPLVKWQGERSHVLPDLTAGKGVVVSVTFAHKHHKKPGDTVELQTATGRRSFPVLATLTDYTSDQGSIFIDRDLYVREWQDDRVDTFEPYLKPGVDPEQVRQEIVRRWGPQYKLFALTNKQFREEIARMIERVFSITRALEFVTIFISLLSVVNTLLTTILDRMREIGVLRAIGMLRGQLARMIVIESTVLALIGAAVGIAVGTVNGILILTVVEAQDTGWEVPLRFPGANAAFYAAVLVLVGIAAALYPSRVAGRVQVVDALGYE